MEKTYKIVLISMSALLALILCSILVFKFIFPKNNVIGEFQAPEFEVNALSGIPSDDNILKEYYYSEAKLNDDISVSLCGLVLLHDGKARVCFTSSADNTCWVKANLYDENGSLLGESGILKPGEYVMDITLNTEFNGDTAVVKIITYEPDTYYSLGTASATVGVTTG